MPARSEYIRHTYNSNANGVLSEIMRRVFIISQLKLMKDHSDVRRVSREKFIHEITKIKNVITQREIVTTVAYSHHQQQHRHHKKTFSYHFVKST